MSKVSVGDMQKGKSREMRLHPCASILKSKREREEETQRVRQRIYLTSFTLYYYFSLTSARDVWIFQIHLNIEQRQIKRREKPHLIYREKHFVRSTWAFDFAFLVTNNLLLNTHTLAVFHCVELWRWHTCITCNSCFTSPDQWNFNYDLYYLSPVAKSIEQ